MMNKIEAMPFRLLRIPKDINQTMYDIKIPSNPLFEKIWGILTRGRIMKNKDEFNELVLVDEEKLLELWRYLNENKEEVVKSLEKHNKELRKVWGKPNPHDYNWLEKFSPELIVRQDGYFPLKDVIKETERFVN